MATVYLAEDLMLRREVALKLLHPDLASTVGRERFLREIDITSRLIHPNILPLHDAGEADGRLFYAMPFVEGESLRQRIEREGQLPVPDAIGILQDVAAALNHAHACGVIHRDVKPENILLAAGKAVVADFGIAHALDAAGGERLTASGLALGTPGYMSPEQASPGARLDPRSDIYALGCVAYEMLAGAPPFTGPTSQSILARHAVDSVPPLRTVRAAVPERVERAVLRALAKVPADRFASASEFAAALSTGAHSAPADRRPKPDIRPKHMLGMLAGVAVVVVGIWAARGSPSSTVLPSAARIAVLPPSIPTGDTSLNRLGRDLSVTIGASLEGIGGIEIADRLLVAKATADKGSLSIAEAGALARRLGAASVLRGTLVGVGDHVRLDLGLYDADSLVPLIEGLQVTSHRDSIGPLTDSVTWAVLRHVWQRGEPPSPSLAAVTTRSLPALRSFLDGERHLERGWWYSAALAYRSAIAVDSSFWLAYFRYADAQSWNDGDVEPDIMDVMLHHLDVLPERERLLVEAYGRPGEWGTPDLYKEVTRRFPAYWPAWFKWGDWLHHVGPLRGYTWKDADEALRRAVALNPSLAPAWDHLFRNSVGYDTLRSAQALTRLEQVQSSDPAADHRDEADIRLYRLYHALERSAGVLLPDDIGLADSIARLSLSPEATDLLRILAPIGLLWAGNPAGQVEFNLRLIRAAGGPDAAAPAHFGRALGWAERGAWDSALTAMHHAATGRPAQFAIHDYSLAVLGAWLGAVPPVAATGRRLAAHRVAAASLDPEKRALLLGTLAWLDGLAAFAERDGSALARAASAALGSGHPAAVSIERSLVAFARALEGDHGGAGRELAALERQCAERAQGCDVTAPNIAANRLAAATWLLEAGDTVEAAYLLTWHDAHIPGWNWSFVVAPLAFLMQARIAEAWGDTATASAHYRQFLRRYDRPLPAQAHLVEEARVALARTAGEAEPAADR
jgi:hypothetical protein